MQPACRQAGLAIIQFDCMTNGLQDYKTELD